MSSSNYNHSDPHPLLTKDERFDVQLRNGWGTSLFEFEPRANGEKYPHIILLSEQYNTCDSQSILHGELEVIITAMRNRANQLVEEDEDRRRNMRKRMKVLLLMTMLAPQRGPNFSFQMNQDSQYAKRSLILFTSIMNKLRR